jgi:hypothetical protein
MNPGADANRQAVVLYGRFPFAVAALLLLPCLVISGLAVYVLATTDSPGGALVAQVAFALAGSALLCWGAVFVYLAMRLRRPALIMTPAGIRRSDIALRWCDVASVGIQRYFGQPYVALTLRDPEAFLRALPTYASTAYAGQLRRTNERILLPAARGLSTAQLCDLIGNYWKQGSATGHSAGDFPSAYARFRAGESATFFAVSVLGAFFVIRWTDLIGYLRARDAVGLLENAAAGVAVTVAAYLTVWLVLRRLERMRPGFDLWQTLSIPTDFVGGVNPALYDALGARAVREEPYVQRLQKAPWRVVLYAGLVGGGGLLVTGALQFGITYLLETGPSSASVAEIRTAQQPFLRFMLILLLLDAACVAIAFFKLKYASKT